MGMEHPSHVHRLYERAFNDQDLPALLALYAPDAKLIAGPGKEAAGHDGIAAALREFFAMKGTIRLKTIWVVEADNLALSRGRWTLNGTGPDGEPVAMDGHCIDVFQKQPDGSWLLVIDNPFGGE